MVQYEDNESFWNNVNKLSKNPDRPKRNSTFLLFLVVVGIAGVVAFSVLATTTQSSKSSCPCANPYKQLGNGERIPDISQCEKDMTYMDCYNKKSKQYTMYAGLAGGSAGLLVLSLLLFRYG
jgi:hypothetical protein